MSAFTMHQRRQSIRVKVALSALVLALLGALAGLGTWAAFSATTDNAGNTFAAGTVVLSDNDGGSTPMLTLSAARPDDTDVSCITVTYSGSLDAQVSLYGVTGGDGLDQYLDLTVTRGSGLTNPYDDCAGFTPDATDYRGDGAGVVYQGTLRDFWDDWDTSEWDPYDASPELWTTGESHAYRFEITVKDDNAAQGLTATQIFTWEARNV
jgi:predicted ribosomally synthesized peptide with SipW-like signal peptide